MSDADTWAVVVLLYLKHSFSPAVSSLYSVVRFKFYLVKQMGRRGGGVFVLQTLLWSKWSRPCVKPAFVHCCVDEWQMPDWIWQTQISALWTRAGKRNNLPLCCAPVGNLNWIILGNFFSCSFLVHLWEQWVAGVSCSHWGSPLYLLFVAN